MSSLSPVYIISQIPEFINLLKNDDNLDEKTHKLNKINSKEEYSIIKYNKNVLTHDEAESYGLFRSVVINKNKKVVSFAPPKSIQSDKFIRMYEDVTNTDILVEEFIEGTMINVFWDYDFNVWKISTKSTIGAESCFFKSENSKTFNTMFFEALQKSNLKLEYLEKKFCYSFVLQHPENRIVVPFKETNLYLVSVYEIKYINFDIHILPVNINNIKYMFYETNVLFPKTLKFFKSYTEIIEQFASMNTPYYILGIIIKNEKTGQRCKIRNPVYEKVRQLRGNQPKLQYHYLCLRKEGKVGEFLKYFPENKNNFSSFRNKLHLLTNTLYKNYISCYIHKEKPLLEYLKEYRVHMFNIHQKFLNELKEKKLFVNKEVVINYINDLHPSQVMYWLNYNMRNIENNNVENNM